MQRVIRGENMTRINLLQKLHIKRNDKPREILIRAQKLLERSRKEDQKHKKPSS
jgi:hypothetical protein